MSIDSILNISSTVSGILPVIAALYNFKYLDKTLKIAGAFFLFSFLFDVLLELLTTTHMPNNMPFIHFFVVVNVFFFGAIYYNAYFKVFLKKVSAMLSLIVLLIMVVNLIFIEGIWQYPSVSITVLSVLLIFFSLAYFYQLLSRQEFVHIEKIGMFWINAGILLYFAINIFVFMLFNQILVAHQQAYYMIHNSTNIIANLLYTAGLLCKPQKIN